MFHLVTQRSLAAVGLAAVLAAPMAWSQDAPPVRVRGTIERIESPVFVVKSRDGAELKIVRVLLPNSTVFMNPGFGPERRGLLKPKVAV